MRTVKFLFACAFAAVLCSCGQKTGTAWLSGEFSSNAPAKVSFTVLPRGAESYKVKSLPVVDGKFLLEVPDIVGAAEVEFPAGATYMGASLVPGDTLHMTISPVEGTERFVAEFAGKTAEASKVFNGISSAYNDFYTYYYECETFDDALVKLEENSTLFHEANDASMDKYFKHLAALRYDDMKTQLLLYKAEEEGGDITECEEYNEIISKVDPNDPANVSGSLVSKWLQAGCPKDENLTETGKLISMLKVVSDKISNPVVKKNSLAGIAESMFMEGEDTDAESIRGFWTAFTEAAAGYPELIEANEEAYNTRLAMAKGTPVKDFTIQTPDGRELPVSSLYGKVLYIDIWATWCGPCRGEIPYLAEVAKHYAGSEDVYVMSVSCDQTPEPWLEMITADKPAWPQYYISRENMKDLDAGFNVAYIPRFIIIDKEGRIFNAYAPRPSSEDVYAEIDACVAK